MSRPAHEPAPTPVAATLPELLSWAARHRGDAPCLLRPADGEWHGYSYREVAQAAWSFAALLQSLGVAPGARVALHSENRPEWGIAYFAIAAAGAVAVPLDAQLGAREVGEILATAEASHVIASARLQRVSEQARDARRPQLAIVSLDGEGPGTFAEARRRFAGAPQPPVRAVAGDLAVLIFTSGTTGQAKGVMLSHANLLSNVESAVRTIPIHAHDRMLSVLPLHHTFECTVGMLCPIRVGASVAYARSLKSNELREDVRSSRATIVLGVPLLYEKLVAAIERGIEAAPPARRRLARALLALSRLARQTLRVRPGRPLLTGVRRQTGMGRVRLFVSGAAALRADVFWGLVDLGWTVLEGYGLTECSPIVAASRPENSVPGAVGWPLAGVQLRIENPDADGNGEIVVRGPNVMLGYWRQPEATAQALQGGEFHTGDLGRLLPDGRLVITGRIKNMIATEAGKKIYPEEVEAALASALVAEALVVGGRDRDGREEVHAHLVPDLPALEALARETGVGFDDAFVETTLRALVERAGEGLAPYKRVKRVFIRREEFARTTTGKLRRPASGERPA
ncbi:MAG TPA: AMP-binding protein [Candidatus Eisenbacteria bacterium]|nr:AMP-binding protein [Candidatus Eisenbacteria bacterium]